MDRRESAREYFKRLGLSYADIKESDIYKLNEILNEKVKGTEIINRCFVDRKYFNKDTGSLVFAEIRVTGKYFDNREGISFYEYNEIEGEWIGIIGWADTGNLTPFIEGFEEWCDYLKDKKVNK